MTVEQLKTEADKLGYQIRRKGSKREYVNSENPDGTRPLNTLAPFYAEPKRTGNISISSAARRLAALAQAGRA